MGLLDFIIGWFFLLPKLWRGPARRGIPRRGVFVFCFFYVIFSQMVINGQQKWFLDQIFWKNMIFGQILSYLARMNLPFVIKGGDEASNLIKSDQISSFFKKSGPEITFFENIWPFWARLQKRKKRPCEATATTEPILGWRKTIQ